MIERNGGSELGDATTKRAGKGNGSVARIDVHHALIPRGDDGDKAVLARLQVALVLQVQIGTHRVVDHHLVDGKKVAYLLGAAKEFV